MIALRGANTFKGKSLPKHLGFISPSTAAHVPVKGVSTGTTTRQAPRVSRSLSAYSKESLPGLHNGEVRYTKTVLLPSSGAMDGSEECGNAYSGRRPLNPSITTSYSVSIIDGLIMIGQSKGNHNVVDTRKTRSPPSTAYVNLMRWHEHISTILNPQLER